MVVTIGRFSSYSGMFTENRENYSAKVTSTTVTPLGRILVMNVV